MASGCYVYAILARETPLPPGFTGFGGAPVSMVPWRALAAATSPLESGTLRPTTENVLRHEAIVEVLRQLGPALPVRFGTVLADAQAVARALAERYDVLMADLARLGDKVELGLSVLWDPPSSQGEEPATGSAAAQEAQGPGARYLQARLAAHRREAAVQDRARALAREMDSALCVHALERRCTILPTPRLAVRAAYLLDPGRVPAFQDTFAEIRRAHPDLRFLLSGPWPPYSFVTPPEGGERLAISGRLRDAGPHGHDDTRRYGETRLPASAAPEVLEPDQIIDPGDVSRAGLLRLARNRKHAGAIHQAIRAYTEVLRRYPGTGAASAALEELMGLAEDLEQQGKVHTAMYIFNKVEQLL